MALCPCMACIPVLVQPPRVAGSSADLESNRIVLFDPQTVMHGVRYKEGSQSDTLCRADRALAPWPSNARLVWRPHANDATMATTDGNPSHDAAASWHVLDQYNRSLEQLAAGDVALLVGWEAVVVNSTKAYTTWRDRSKQRHVSASQIARDLLDDLRERGLMTYVDDRLYRLRSCCDMLHTHLLSVACNTCPHTTRCC